MPRTDCIFCSADAYPNSKGAWECDFGHTFEIGYPTAAGRPPDQRIEATPSEGLRAALELIASADTREGERAHDATLVARAFLAAATPEEGE
jgi:hypothetical protein